MPIDYAGFIANVFGIAVEFH
ncbi:uncharacterized protein G2W53_006999 [Senna tora]|uniref:Uncharacterized protein n=1 Tax=Senna tora TaxID=362788 RepID=A0A835CGZ5_9FABA|nr:uncharacterized protein G2W53_006999 [Senna tora]